MAGLRGMSCWTGGFSRTDVDAAFRPLAPSAVSFEHPLIRLAQRPSCSHRHARTGAHHRGNSRCIRPNGNRNSSPPDVQRVDGLSCTSEVSKVALVLFEPMLFCFLEICCPPYKWSRRLLAKIVYAKLLRAEAGASHQLVGKATEHTGPATQIAQAALASRGSASAARAFFI
jgi:hypothetical protein